MKKHLCSNTVFSFSQYGHCQTFKLPSGEFELSKDPEKEGREALEKYKMSDSHGYILEVDLVRLYGKKHRN